MSDCGYPRKFPPFNVGQKRFLGIGVHPAFISKGMASNVEPGRYESEGPAPRNRCQDWSNKARIEEFSKNLGYRNRKVLEDRLWDKASGGPTSDVHLTFTGINANKRTTSFDNAGFTKAVLSRDVKQRNIDTTPGPGTYDTGLSTLRVVSPQPNPGRIVPRFTKDKRILESIGPGVYEPKYKGTLNALLTKMVSKRGPYQLFTGPRDGTTLNGYLNQPVPGGLQVAFIMPNDLDTFKHRKAYGKWFPGDRFSNAACSKIMSPPKDPSEPGPDHYNIKSSIIAAPPNKKPFNDSKHWTRPIKAREMIPAPGRYDGNDGPTRRITGDGHKYIYLSKSLRSGDIPPITYNAF